MLLQYLTYTTKILFRIRILTNSNACRLYTGTGCYHLFREYNINPLNMVKISAIFCSVGMLTFERVRIFANYRSRLNHNELEISSN
jgi:hypothetical protein